MDRLAILRRAEQQACELVSSSAALSDEYLAKMREEEQTEQDIINRLTCEILDEAVANTDMLEDETDDG